MSIATESQEIWHLSWRAADMKIFKGVNSDYFYSSAQLDLNIFSWELIIEIFTSPIFSSLFQCSQAFQIIRREIQVDSS